MKKTQLEEKISMRATENFNEEMLQIERFVAQHPFCGWFKVFIMVKEKPVEVSLRSFLEVRSLMDFKNFQEVKETRLKELEKKYTKEVLDKITNLEYLFNQ